MEKYFSIEVRLADGVEEIRPGITRLVDKFYYGDGYIRIYDDKISGFIALDYIEGKIGREAVEMYLYTEDAEIEIKINKDDFYLPQSFLIEYDDIAVEICVIEPVNNPQKQNGIRNQIECARRYSMTE